jgi:threonine/homoserine/homoserine lactone efflux protein
LNSCGNTEKAVLGHWLASDDSFLPGNSVGEPRIAFRESPSLIERDGVDGLAADRSGPAGTLWTPFRRGVAMNVLNPKVALFFLAFLPQFVEVERGHVGMQIAFLGLLLTALGILTDGCYALAAGTAGNWLKRSPAYLKAERYVSGLLFIGLGLTAAFAGSQKK